MAAAMAYLTDHRAQVRMDPRRLLESAKSMLVVGKLYNTPHPRSTEYSDPELGWISRYAWGQDYHDVLRTGLENLVRRLQNEPWMPSRFESKICVDTAPLLERSYARDAGLGWIGRNTCLIHEPHGSWFFLGALLLSEEFEPDSRRPDRCGTCTRCIDACPTAAIVAAETGSYIDSRQCISYFTIELRGPIQEEQRRGVGRHVFGCDICQDVCPWNRRAPFTGDPAFAPMDGLVAPPLEKLANLSADEFRQMFRGAPVWRSKYSGFLRNVAAAMGNSGLARFRAPLERLAASPDHTVAEQARWSLNQLEDAV